MPGRVVSADVLADICWRKVPWLIPKILFLVKSLFLDVHYLSVREDELHSLLKAWRQNILPKLRYRYDYWDCDDYARYFVAWFNLVSKTNAGGETYGVVKVRRMNGAMRRWESYGHSWVGVLVDFGYDVDVVFVEPQLGEIVETEREFEPEYPIKLAKGHTIGATMKYVPEFYRF